MDGSKRAAVSGKDILSKNRRLELKYFCMQYDDWIEMKRSLEGIRSSSVIRPRRPLGGRDERMDMLADISRCMKLVELCAKDTDRDLSEKIFIAATKGFSYRDMVDRYGLEIDKSLWDILMSRFYNLLSFRKGL